MRLRRWAFLAAVIASRAGAEPPQPLHSPDPDFAGAFEWTQRGPGRSLVLSTQSRGRVTHYRAVFFAGDRLVHIWGAGRPAAPVFLSPERSVRFSILESYALFELKLAPDDAAAHAWKQLSNTKTEE